MSASTILIQGPVEVVDGGLAEGGMKIEEALREGGREGELKWSLSPGQPPAKQRALDIGDLATTPSPSLVA